MFDFLHNYQPQATVISLGGVQIYWYGLFIVAGILTALTITLKLAKKVGESQNNVFDLAFWLIIFGIIGARIYHVLLEIDFYIQNPLNVFKLWEGGLAIHGAIITGLITLYIFCQKKKMNFWLITAISVPGLALAQAIGRFGNYFNQELFGKPTTLPWGIPIELIKRPHRYISNEFFHPTFIYESIGSICIFAILLFLVSQYIKKKKPEPKIIVIVYLILYSVLRFSTEFIRIDKTPYLLGLRLPQIASLAIIIACVGYVFWEIKNKKKLILKTISEPVKNPEEKNKTPEKKEE